MSAVTIDQLSVEELRSAIRSSMRFGVGPFSMSLTSTAPDLVSLVHDLYGGHPIIDPERAIDFHIRLSRPIGLRRWIKPKIYFSVDGQYPFDPFPLNTAFPQLEWGINWCIAMHAHREIQPY